MNEKQYVLAVPNFSEGRRKEVIETVVDAVRNIEGVRLVSYEPEHDFNRTVVTLIGEPQPIKEALLALAGKSYELINMEDHQGTHPRIGAQDTLPIFPFKNITLDECKVLAEEIGVEVFKRYEVPVFFSGVNARNEDRKALSFIRKGQYEGLKLVAHTDERKPDIGPAALHPTAGATIVSADLEGLTAYNVFLSTENVEIAKAIAKGVRGPSGGFSTIRAVGIKFPEREGTVVSMNMFDCGATPLYRAYNFVKDEAARYGVIVTGSEIVGPVKLDYLLNSLEYYLGLENLRKDQILETHLMK
ncbi:glutamate formiminotransferase/formiminotetrahydrofolate cyclodeaminase [Anaerosolibacter carboniphilus]|uniref:glutamate formimidoyltransferase n=1 Tax=Anaerosolibacter carboniphilus TaxID=1417629 RepID=A0A841KP14_9FIRM|nr:glutamate formimidoyltransferase [Anaerosolibacter carboniphilus]MBB6215153.1 glutamate formiminotransferase/formiminotetrahydrofolate cyclodeaminase [Anaerosolibacter carboniphilus]